MRKLLLALAFAGLMFGQAPGLTPGSNSQPQGADTSNRYQAIHAATSATSDAVTVQQVASGQHGVIFENAWVYCSAACSFTIEQNGVAATTTALTIARMNLSSPSTVKAFSASNMSSPAFTSAAYQLAAGASVSVDLSKFFLSQSGGTGQNLTVAVTSSSGTIETTIQWVEK